MSSKHIYNMTMKMFGSQAGNEIARAANDKGGFAVVRD